MFHEQIILITGGSGSWGNELTKQLLETNPKKIIIFSRGEIAQVAMQRKFNNPKLEFVIGDVRDAEAVDNVLSKGIDYVFHLAALKHVPVCEYNPQEAIKTNIQGTSNLIKSATRHKVKKFIYVSTDKAVDPVNLYGMTKGAGERLVIEANRHTKFTDFLCIRAGNVLGTNGSLVPALITQIQTKNEVLLTDPSMTRFFLTLPHAISLLFFAVQNGQGGEIYVMNMPSFYISDLIRLLVEYYGDGETAIKIIGTREGEKIHEVLISDSEKSRVRYVDENYHVIYPQIDVNRTNIHIWDKYVQSENKEGYSSKDNLRNVDFLKDLLEKGGFLK